MPTHLALTNARDKVPFHPAFLEYFDDVQPDKRPLIRPSLAHRAPFWAQQRASRPGRASRLGPAQKARQKKFHTLPERPPGMFYSQTLSDHYAGTVTLSTQMLCTATEIATIMPLIVTCTPTQCHSIHSTQSFTITASLSPVTSPADTATMSTHSCTATAADSPASATLYLHSAPGWSCQPHA
eukprot:gene10446-1894_t